MDQQVKKNRFSVIIIGYNIESYIQRAIMSVENQSFKNIEIIVIDDCSTDRTNEKIVELSSKYNNIIVKRHDKNKRAGGARNTGLDIATGEYIVFLDGDDYLANSEVLSKLDKTIGNDNPDVIYLGFKIEGDREELVIPNEENCTKTYRAAIDRYPNPWSKCWRREFLNENNIRFPENRYYEDVLFVYNGVMKSRSYKIANFVVHHYISGRKDSMTTKISLKNIKDTVQNLEDLLVLKNTEPTKEIDIIIKKEIDMCKKRLDKVMEEIFHDKCDKKLKGDKGE